MKAKGRESGQIFTEYLCCLCSFTGGAVIYISQMRNPRLKDVGELALGHRVCNDQGWNSLSDLPDSWSQAVFVMPFHCIKRRQENRKKYFEKERRIGIFTKEP